MHAVAFDMDGVLVDTNAAIERAWRSAASMYGVHVSDADLRTHVHGQPATSTLRALFPGHTPMQRQEVWRHAARIEEQIPYQPMPGVLPLLRALADSGIAVTLVTSNLPGRVAAILDLIGAADAFRTVVSRDDTVNGKPHPEPYLTAASRLGVPPQRMLVFEDSDSGIRAASAAGCACVAVRQPSKDPNVVAVVPDFTGIAVTRDDSGTPILTGVPGTPVIRLVVRRSRTA